MNNDPFARHSWYFRNALVRANYRNVAKSIDYTPVYLERFFRNLLLGEQCDLRNRYLHIRLTVEWGVQPNLTQETPEQAPEQAPEQVYDLLHTNNSLIEPTLKSPEMSIPRRNLCAAAPRPLRGGVEGRGVYLSAAE